MSPEGRSINLPELQSQIRENLKDGVKPRLKKGDETLIDDTIDEIINQNTELIAVLTHPHRIKERLALMVRFIAKESLRNTNSNLSILNEDKLKILIEFLVVNLSEVEHHIRTLHNFDEKSSEGYISEVSKIAAYHDSEFVHSFLFDNSLIASKLGITEDEVKKLFPPYVRMHFLVHNLSDPIEALTRVRENLETELTNQKIMEALDISEEKATREFPNAVRLNFAMNNIRNPMKGLRKWHFKNEKKQ